MAAQTVRAQAHARRTVGRFAPALLALVCTALLAPFIMAGTLAVDASRFEIGEPAPLTLRVSPLAPSPLGKDGGAIAVARGETVDAAAAALAARQSSAGRWVVLSVLFLGILLWSRLLQQDHRGRLLRVQLATLGMTGALVIVASVALLLTSISHLAIPVSMLAFLVGRRSHRSVAIASAALGVLLVASLEPLDLGILAVLGVQAIVPALFLPRYPSLLRTALIAVAASLAAGLAYALAHLAAFGIAPPLAGATHSTWLAAALGAPLGALLAQPLRPVYSWLCGDVSSPTLSRLERLSQPLLKQIAEKAPGTWQHSLAMANLAEAAGRTIGADVQLLRVGAYYHDLGKSLQPKHFIENQQSGETSLHDNLSAQASRDGIFSHVTGGIAAAREARLPERIIDFIRSHHAGGLLEYFWTKQSEEHPGAELSEDFCYPGSRPQCPETGIMCICDAVEGATRTLKSPAAGDIETIVDHILFGKVRTGQLDECGLTLRELLQIRDALCTALRTAHAPAHARLHGADAISTANARPVVIAERGPALSMQGLHAVRLDSLDRPSSAWQAQTSKPAPSTPESADLALARTESIPEGAASKPTGQRTAATFPEVDAASLIAPETELEIETDPDLGSVPESVPVPASEPVPAPEPEPESEPEIALALDVDLEPVQLSHLPAASTVESLSELQATRSLGRPAAQELEAPDDDGLEVLLLNRPRTKEAIKATAASLATPPPPPQKRFTIPLGEGEPSVQPALASRRADSQDGLRPGEMVIGAPPSTHPERGGKRAPEPEEETVLRHMPLPSEARRPEDRITEELAFVPPEAYGEDTIPRSSRPRSESEDPE